MTAATAPASTDGPVGRLGGHTAQQPLALGAVRLDPAGNLGAWQELTSAATIPHCVEQVEDCGAMDNLRRVVGESSAEFRGYWFADSDVHKTLEAVGWELGRREDRDLRAWLESTTRLLRRVQDDDGYLDSWVQGGREDERWARLHWSHEMYVVGHLVQAAVAAVRGAGDLELLEVARRAADLLVERFGPDGEAGIDGHPEIETALVELTRLTGDPSYLATARRMIDERGRGLLGDQPYGRAYFQDHEPVLQATYAAGHAVRQLYLAAGVVDVAVETEDDELLAAAERLWEDVVARRSYLTGGVGSRHRDESFGDAFELPPDRAYAETCAAIASVMWNWRLLLATGRRRYADELERTLLNAVASGLGTDGRHFFYSNPLQRRGDHDGSHEDSPSTRLPWYSIPCCPPNLARLGASLHAYVAAWDDAGLVLHQYAAGRVTGGGPQGHLAVEVETDYPWDGRVVVDVVEADGDAALAVRVPGWCADPVVEVDGRHVTVAEDGYVRVDAPAVGTRLVLDLPMPARVVRAHPRVDAVRGCVALVRGPVVHAVEQVDLPDGVDVDDLVLEHDVRPTGRTADVAGRRVTVLEVPVVVRSRTADMPLYVDAAEPSPPDVGRLVVPAVPYASWANRGGGAMRVWLPVREVVR